MEYKYEPVFGDQSLFDGAPEDAVSVRYGKSEHIFDSEEIKATTGQLRDVPVVAMRRIIQEPKHWTWADKEAGRLPEVGSNAQYINQGIVVEVLAIKNGWIVVVNVDGINREPFILPTSGFIKYYNPIESPEEKAQRLEDEFVKSEMKDTTLSIEWACVYERGVRAAYRRLSGDLPVPVKDGE